ncbi:uncharacterized protein LOC111344359 [Stylophora pistillata]|uniref:uncharacterized protein LOC111344359 n=1 Tax=Stylophora pistillata TaxID=50429 RepID=UPI000C047D63|nr:uncharacterized protein LOC111344359 [Stylophora pistillata]
MYVSCLLRSRYKRTQLWYSKQFADVLKLQEDFTPIAREEGLAHRRKYLSPTVLNKMMSTSLQVVLVLVVFTILPISISGNPVWERQRGKKRVVDYNVHISESGVKYTERIEVDQNKNTELFQVPAHPGVDRGDILHDFNKNLTILRSPEQNTCYLFPLATEQTTPEKLLRDLDKASGVVVTESKRVDSTWILDGQLTDRSTLSEELAHFCAKYSIYHVKKTQDSLSATRVQAEGSHTIRKRRTKNINKLCPGGMDIETASFTCSDWPRFKCRVQTRTCYKYVICSDEDEVIDLRPQSRIMQFEPPREVSCRKEHIYRAIVCCEYSCNNNNN